MRRICRNDLVKIISGDHSGSIGSVLDVRPSKSGFLIAVDGIPTQVRPKKGKQRGAGSKVDVYRYIHESNVVLLLGDQPARVNRKREGKRVFRVVEVC